MDSSRPTVGRPRPWRPPPPTFTGLFRPQPALRTQPRSVIVRRRFGVRPVSEIAPLTGNPVDPPGLTTWAKRVFFSKGRLPARRLGVIYGPDGAILAEVPLPDDED